jgi:hypothetical protein
MNFGAGNSGAGNSIAGFGSVNTALSVDTNFLPNPNTGAVMDAPLIQAVGFVNQGGLPVLDLVYDQVGVNLQGMNSIDQQVVLAIGTIRGTSVNVNVGSELFNILVLNPDNYQALVQSEVNDALGALISSDSINLDSVTATIDPQVSSRGTIVITYTNNTTNKQKVISL